jgi:hypothetical protein
MAEGVGHSLQHEHRLLGNFRPNAIARENRKF